MNDIVHLAKLANLKLTGREVKKFSTQLSSIISYFEELKKLRIDEIELTSLPANRYRSRRLQAGQTTALKNVFRPDKVEEDNILKKEEALSGTEEVFNDMFVTEAVIEKNS